MVSWANTLADILENTVETTVSSFDYIRERKSYQ